MSKAPALLSAEEIAALRQTLKTGRSWEKEKAITTAALAGAAAADLVPDLMAMLTTDEYVPVTSREYAFSGHDVLAFSAMQAIESIGVAPDIDALRTVLADRRVYELPEASYDQGAYIGDYGTEYVAPAALAARLVRMLGPAGCPLSPALAVNAEREEKLIWESAVLALRRLIPIAAVTMPEGAGVAAVVRQLTDLPAATGGERSYALRDLRRMLDRHFPADA